MGDLLLCDQGLIQLYDILVHQVRHDLPDGLLVHIVDHDLVQLLARPLPERSPL
jgi:hypothetical protein